MKLCIINGSIREKNNSSIVVAAFADAARTNGSSVSECSISPFSELFTGTFTYVEHARPEQKVELLKMRSADTLLFVVPTYYKGMPGALKNFFDLIRSPEVYAEKTIGFVSSNHKNQDFGARQAFTVMQGLLEFFSVRSMLVPEIAIQHHEHLEQAEIERFLSVLENYSMLTKEG